LALVGTTSATRRKGMTTLVPSVLVIISGALEFAGLPLVV
jgi:hypothetical protein